MSKLTVRNMAQKIAFMCEMKGQISDGQWENSRPHDHYKSWMLDWEDVEVGDDVGRDFWVEKDNYNFTNSNLLDVVGSRLLLKIKLAMLYHDVMPLLQYDHCVIPETPQDFSKMMKEAHNAYGWYQLEKLLDDHPGAVPQDIVAQVRRNAAVHALNRAQKLEDAGINTESYVAAMEWDGYTMKDLRKDLKDLKAIVRIQK